MLLESIVGYCYTKVLYNVGYQKGHDTLPSVMHQSGSDVPENVTRSWRGYLLVTMEAQNMAVGP